MTNPRRTTIRIEGYGWGGFAAFLEHRDDAGGANPTIMVNLPEASLAHWRRAMKFAKQRRARVAFLADTAEQADAAVTRGLAELKQHRLVAGERAQAGGWGKLQ